VSGPGQQGRRPDYSSVALAGTAVTELVAPIVIGLWLDGRFGWAPWGLATGAVIGFVGGLAHLMWIANRTNGSGGKSDGGG
jgi:ATP synthase protein I